MTLQKGAAYKDRIIVDPNIMVGKPVIKGTRVPVERIIRHLADNPDIDDLLEAFPHITIEDVQACLHYAHDLIDRGNRWQFRSASSRRSTE
jgi:uncharacterized protein (DUF433 family)